MSEASKEFDRMQEEYMDEVKADAVRIMQETLESPDRAMERAKQRWERSANEKYTERQKAQDRKLLAKTVRELPDCPFCGHHPVVTWTSANLVKCGNRDCKLSTCTFRFDEWRERARAVQKVAYTAVVTSVNKSAKETGITRYAECYAETGEDHNGWPLHAKVNVGINVDVNDRLRITVEKVDE